MVGSSRVASRFLILASSGQALHLAIHVDKVARGELKSPHTRETRLIYMRTPPNFNISLYFYSMSSLYSHTPQQEWHTPIRNKVIYNRFNHSLSYRKIFDINRVLVSIARD